ncbi:DUF1579 domain-containing protein [Rubripirellula amarantea]|nr:DUF1579 domain-containing protein [Rubripirellula amarantea]
MIKNFLSVAMLALLCISLSQAQEPDFPNPEPQHQWLKQFVGQWTSSSRTIASGEQPAMQCTGTMDSRMLGEFWIVNEISGDMDGTKFNAILTIGFDSDRKRYVGTWIDSMMNYMWHYEGDVEASGKKLVLIAEGPNVMAEGKTTKFRDSYEFNTPDTLTSTSEVMDDDGNWVTFMNGTVTRRSNGDSGDAGK